MDVQCERCKTEYEFDDALVSGRGTTVRCTHCGHQFKVRRTDANDTAGDRWVVQTGNGQQLTFLTLRELQRAILAKQVARNDMLLLGEATLRPLGSITELEPFFQGRSSSRPPPPAADSEAGHGSAPLPVVPARRTQAFGPPPGSQLNAAALTAPAPVVMAPAPVEPPLPVDVPAASLPPPTVPVRRSMPTGDDEIHDVHSSFRSQSADAFDFPRRRRVGGWVVALVLFIAVGVVGWVVAKPYLVAHNAPGGVGAHLDARAQVFLGEGEKALLEGDLDGAQQDFDKASALAEHDPRLLLDEARVAAARADVPWLKLRLLTPDAAEEIRTTKAQLDERVARARTAADDALSVGPDDRAAVRAKIDALRLQGQRDAARSYVTKVSGIASQPETAYVVAALDLAEAEPFWTTVIDRLRVAAAAEGNAGRARAALVYALARSGDTPGAKAELVKLDAFARPYPCLPNLHAFVERAPPTKAPTERVVAASASRPAAPQAGGVAAAVGAAGDGVPSEQASAMHMALLAIKKGDWGRAHHLYEALVSRNPDDSEALAGIGDVDRAQGDNTGAISAYKRALAVNPSYLPALLGVADTQWASGDHVSARRSYKDIVDRFPDGTYPSYVKGRSESQASPSATPSATSVAKPYDPGDGI